MQVTARKASGIAAGMKRKACAQGGAPAVYSTIALCLSSRGSPCAQQGMHAPSWPLWRPVTD